MNIIWQIIGAKVSFDRRFYMLVLLNTLIYGYALFVYGSVDFTRGNTSVDVTRVSISVLRGLGFNIGFMGLLWFVLSFIGNTRVHNIAINVVVALCLVLLCMELFILMQFGVLMNPIIMDIVLSTNPSEAREFIDFYVNANLFDGSKSSRLPYILIVFLVVSVGLLRLPLPSANVYSILVFILSALCFVLNVGAHKHSNAIYRLIVAFQEARERAAGMTLAHKNFLISKQDSINAMKLENAGGGGGISNHCYHSWRKYAARLSRYLWIAA